MSEPHYNYLDLLNDQQRDAVVYKDGPALVIAGAGSGKTRVLTYKIVDLLEHGYEPYRILALTFTNKAAREMKERIAALTGPDVSARLWMGTFHSMFLRILRHHAEVIGFKPGFTIYDTTDSRSLVKMIIKELSLDEKIYKPAAIASAISNAKNAMISPEQYVLDKDLTDADRRAKRPMTGRIYQLYAQRCLAANAMDFDDILYFMNLLLRDNPDICRHYREFFKYILVDEYQDTNFAQHLVIKQLAGEQMRLCVVGDDAQSIYSFRGANIGNIINLEKRYPGLRIFKLERNYRSTQNIVNAAGSLISRNTRQLKKNVYSENAVGDPIEIIKTYSDMEEAYMVANKLSQSKHTHHDPYDEYAILYRTNAQSRVLEEALRKRNIPYRIYGGLSFYQRKEVKDAISYFRLSINPDDDEALRRIINYPTRGIGDTTMKKLQAAGMENGVSLWNVISDPDKYKVAINSGTKKKLDNFAAMIALFVEDARSHNAYETGQLIINRTGILTDLAHDSTPESISKQENLRELLVGLKDFVDSRIEEGQEDASMRAFLSEVMLATDQDKEESGDEAKVTLMTVHAAKGLEFKHIFIVGVEEELFPSAMSMDSLAQIEEERRLLYVAITRAKETCTITFAGSRFRNGQTVMTRPSRFLSEIDPKYLKMVSSINIGEETLFINPLDNFRDSRSYSNKDSARSMGYKGAGRPSYTAGNNPERRGSSPHSSPISSLSPNMRKVSSLGGSGIKGKYSLSDISVGTRIEHPKLGIGTVTATGNVSGEESITVDFGSIGIKKLLLRFAVFNILN
ncbi:MAG: UvrD-helicase domain-containing protein [Muribaculaceae bacterium]|nr:UvrD-helicase domain-containing protein [Muribaculaceae bacterium]